jgi:hypothetical protein
MKYRLIECNDGKFYYEMGHEDTSSMDRHGKHPVRWERCNYLIFNTEESARNHFLEIMKFIHAHDTKRVIEEIEI